MDGYLTLLRHALGDYYLGLDATWEEALLRARKASWTPPAWTDEYDPVCMDVLYFREGEPYDCWTVRVYADEVAGGGHPA